MGLTIAFYVTIFVFGIVIGSFLNVLIDDLKKYETNFIELKNIDDRVKKEDADGRSS